MITYALFAQIRQLRDRGLSARQIARELKLGRRTVRRWLCREQFQPRAKVARASKLDPWRRSARANSHASLAGSINNWSVVVIWTAAITPPGRSTCSWSPSPTPRD